MSKTKITILVAIAYVVGMATYPIAGIVTMAMREPISITSGGHSVVLDWSVDKGWIARCVNTEVGKAVPPPLVLGVQPQATAIVR